MAVGNETPSLEHVIKQAIEARICELHTTLPGIVVIYDGKKAQIQPQLMTKFSDGTPELLPLLVNVPVLWPSTVASGLTLPLLPGDTGLVVFSERSLDRWKLAGGILDPDDPRKFDLSDGVFLPGLKPFAQPSDWSATKLTLKNALAKLIMDLTGEIELKNSLAKLHITPGGSVTLEAAPLIGSITAAAKTVNLGSASPGDAAALASSTDSRISAVETALAAHIIIYNTHVVIPINNAVPDAPFIPIPLPIASTTVKIDP